MAKVIQWLTLVSGAMLLAYCGFCLLSSTFEADEKILVSPVDIRLVENDERLDAFVVLEVVNLQNRKIKWVGTEFC